MKKILFNPDSPALYNNALFKTMDINRLNEAWIELKNKLLAIGYDLQTADDNDLSDCAFAIFFNSASVAPKNSIKNKIKRFLKYNQERRRDFYAECIDKGMEDKIALIIWEGRSVAPENYDPKLHAKFPIILTWDDRLVDNKKFFKFYHPTPHRQPLTTAVPFNGKKMLSLINANKLSSVSGELYSARQNAVSFFEKKLPDLFDLFGPKWNQPTNRWQKYFPFLVKKHSSYHGIAWKKIDTLSKYKFSICYENLAGENGYISEKIFDCFYARTVPIYWGAENIDDYIDKDAFIDRRLFKNNQELLEFITSIDEIKYKSYLDVADKYLTSEKYKLFLPENFANTIINTIKPKL